LEIPSILCKQFYNPDQRRISSGTRCDTKAPSAYLPGCKALAAPDSSTFPGLPNLPDRLLGYFRYDFHPTMLGDGDVGGHPYFHLHREFSADDDETNQEARFATGLISLADVLSICEKNLFENERKERFIEYLADGRFDELALDLAPSGFDQLINEFYTPAQWKKYKHKAKCENFVKRSGWKLPVLEKLKAASRRKKRRRRSKRSAGLIRVTALKHRRNRLDDGRPLAQTSGANRM
jgi:hypothetical protein